MSANIEDYEDYKGNIVRNLIGLIGQDFKGKIKYHQPKKRLSKQDIYLNIPNNKYFLFTIEIPLRHHLPNLVEIGKAHFPFLRFQSDTQYAYCFHYCA